MKHDLRLISMEEIQAEEVKWLWYPYPVSYTHLNMKHILLENMQYVPDNAVSSRVDFDYSCLQSCE